MSLRVRLLIALLAAVLVGVLIVDSLTYTLVTRTQVAQIDQDLERAHPPIERAAQASGDRVRAIRDAAPGFYAELQQPSGDTVVTVTAGSPGDDDDSLAGARLPSPSSGSDDDAVFATVATTGDHPYRVRVSRQPDGDILVIGRSLEAAEHTRQRLIAVLVAASLGALAISALLGLWFVRLGLRPLLAVERAAGDITDADLDQRVPGMSASTEIGRLATAINHMLERLHAAFDQRAEDLTTLRESEARMRQFVADASHELRTPIAATAAYAELFERGARSRPDDLERAMAGIRSETTRMGDLVDDLLLLAQLDEGRPLEHEPVDLAELAFESVDAARTVAPERSLTLRIEELVVVIGDRRRLRQVIDNLLANVRTHTPPTSTCRVTLRREGSNAVLTVSDDGPGMLADDAHHAFDRFHRADTSRTRESGGAGLGLSIVSALVIAHGGTAAMESQPGAGTHVTIHLPAEPPPSDDESSPPSPGSERPT